MKIGITGAQGLLGSHFRAYLIANKESFVCADRDTFSNQEKLKEFVLASDVIVHFAGVNRGTDVEVGNGNIDLAERLVAAMDLAFTEMSEEKQKKFQLFFASSTHVEKNTVYGQSKKKCSKLFQTFLEQKKAKYVDLILPHVFGEGGKPFYNSVISTFCSQLASGDVPQIHQDSTLNLVHCHQVSECILRLMKDGFSGVQNLTGVSILVSEAKVKLEKMLSSYRGGVIPRFENSFEIYLFNTLRSYLFPKFYPVFLPLKSDPRGTLFETVKTDNGGQCFLSSTLPGMTRGNHWHFKKIERFCVTQGEATIRIRHLLNDEIFEFKVSGAQPCYIDMPTLHTHHITNTSKDPVMTLFWSHEIFDSNNPDTFSEAVQK